MHIRSALAADLDEISGFVVRGQDLHREAYSDLFAPLEHGAAKSLLRRYLVAGDTHVRVAERQSAVVGFSFLEIHERKGSVLRLPRKFVYIELIAVDPHHQRSGVGSALLADAKEIAGSLGIHRIELDVMALNDGARRFYVNQGFSKLTYRMYSEEPAV